MAFNKNINRIISLSAFLLLFLLLPGVTKAAGLTVGNETLILQSHENIYYGVTSSTNPTGNFLLFERGPGNPVFKIDYNGNITSNGALLGSNNYFNLNGSNLYASNTAWNLGIGTTSPATKLEILGTTKSTQVSGVGVIGSNWLSGLPTTNLIGVLGHNYFNAGYGVYGSSVNSGTAGYFTASAGTAGYFTSSSGYGLIVASGNVGIGTTTPIYKLEVIGNTSINRVLFNDNGIYKRTYADAPISFQSNYPGPELFDFRYGNSPLLTIRQNGNVGIGTTNPSEKLESRGGTSNSLIYGALLSNTDTTNTGGSMIGLGFAVNNTTIPKAGVLFERTASYGLGNLYFSLNNVSDNTTKASKTDAKMTILNNGYVGIGTTAPNDILSLANGGSAAPAGSLNTGHNFTSTYLSTDKFALANYGLVETLINTNVPPIVSASISSSSLWGGTASGNIWSLNSGNVGIGVTSPAHKLELVASTTAAGGIGFGTDTELYRSAAHTLALASGDSLNLVSGNLQVAGTNVITSSRLILGSNGTVSAPTFSFSADTNTGMYRGGTDILRFSTAGADRMTILANGSVGIGTTTPKTLLEIFSNNGGYDGVGYRSFRLSNNSVGGYTFNQGAVTSVTSYIGFNNYYYNNYQYKPDATYAAGIKYVNGRLDLYNDYGLTVGTAYAPTERISIINGGNVGIGTTTPTSRLVVKGSGSASTTSAVNITNSDNASLLFVRDDKRVGIRTSSPNDVLSIGDNSGVAAPSGSDGTGHNYTSSYLSSDGYALVNYGLIKELFEQKYWTLTDNNLYPTNIANNVGIGTTNPRAVLQTYGALKVGGASNQTTGTIILGDDQSVNQNVGIFRGALNSVGGGNYLNLAGYGGINFTVGSATFGSQTNAMTILSNGNVGIGTDAPAGKLNIARAAGDNLIYADNYSTTAGHSNYWFSRRSRGNTNGTLATTLSGDYQGVFYFQGVNTSNVFAYGAEIVAQQNGSAGTYVPTDLKFSTYSATARNTNQLALLNTGVSYFNAGNVGIGTTSPAQKLHVQSGSWVQAKFESTSTGYAPASILLEAGESNSRGQGLFMYNNVSDESYFWGVPYGTSNDRVILSYANQVSWDSSLAQNSSSLMTILKSGNIGIGTTNPDSLLEVSKSSSGGIGGVVKITNPIASVAGNGVELRLAPSSAHDIRYASIRGINISGNNDIAMAFLTGNGALPTEKMRIDHLGNVGIRTSSPNDIFSIGNSSGVAAPLGSDGTGHNYANGYLSTDPYALVNYGLLNTLINDPTEGYLPLAGGTMVASSSINMNNGNISNINNLSVNKITAVTIDPLYTINGINYSTFAPSIAGGVKEELVGKVDIKRYNGSEYEYKINFDLEKEGTDLWVWRKTVDYSDDNVQVLITPSGGFARVYYVIEGNNLIFRADRPVKASYRLVGNRFDWKNWPTRALDQTEKGVIID